MPGQTAVLPPTRSATILIATASADMRSSYGVVSISSLTDRRDRGAGSGPDKKCPRAVACAEQRFSSQQRTAYRAQPLARKWGHAMPQTGRQQMMQRAIPAVDAESSWMLGRR